MVSTRGQSSLPGAQDTTAAAMPSTTTRTAKASTAGEKGRKEAAKKTTTTAATAKKNKSIDVASQPPPPASPSRQRQRGPSNAATAAPEQAHSPKSSITRAKKAPLSGKQSRQATSSKPTPKKLAADVADAELDASSSDEDEEENDDDGLACLAQGMLDALCGVSGGGKRAQVEEEDDDDDGNVDGDDDDGLRPTTPNDDNNGAAAAAAASSSDSDSESDSGSESDSDDDDDDEGQGKPSSRSNRAKSITWAPRSLLLPAPAAVTSTSSSLSSPSSSSSSLCAVKLLARDSLVSSTPERVAQRRALERARSSASRDWFDLPQQTLTPELKTDLRLLKLRGALDPTRHYKSADTTKLPGRFHVGTVVESATDFYSSRLSKGERGQSLADELLRDRALSAQRKRRFGALQEAAAARGWKGGGGKGAKVRKTTMPRLKKHRVRPKH